MEVLIHRPEILLRTVDDPVGQGRPRDHGAVLGPVFFLAVQRDTVRILLVHSPCNSRGGGWSFSYKSFRNTGFYDDRLPCIVCSLFALRASVTLCIVLVDLAFSRYKYKLTAHILCADQLHLCTAFGAGLLFIRERDNDLIDLDAFERIRMG